MKTVAVFLVMFYALGVAGCSSVEYKKTNTGSESHPGHPGHEVHY